jgi:hypothetical protein
MKEWLELSGAYLSYLYDHVTFVSLLTMKMDLCINDEPVIETCKTLNLVIIHKDYDNDGPGTSGSHL